MWEKSLIACWVLKVLNDNLLALITCKWLDSRIDKTHTEDELNDRNEIRGWKEFYVMCEWMFVIVYHLTSHEQLIVFDYE